MTSRTRHVGAVMVAVLALLVLSACSRQPAPAIGTLDRVSS
ncbi:hypothetical protein [Dietzia sp. CH92]|nr:hypothetical protein [Dietzia sp. CH92]